MNRLKEGTNLILASGSPRRRELLSEAGLNFEVVPTNVNEDLLAGELPEKMVRRLAREKARALLERFPRAVILGADTTVVVSGEILGKPVDRADAARSLGLLQGAVHTVWTAFSLQCAERRIDLVDASSTEVKMIALTPEQIEQYVATGEPMDKAGAYAIQGKGAQLIEWVKGSYTSVIGLNVSSVISTLAANGLLAK